ncbi:hypothetical protein HDV64DRAFT_20626 [Trichoderma sp. TUCIM 5745]
MQPPLLTENKSVKDTGGTTCHACISCHYCCQVHVLAAKQSHRSGKSNHSSGRDKPRPGVASKPGTPALLASSTIASALLFLAPLFSQSQGSRLLACSKPKVSSTYLQVPTPENQAAATNHNPGLHHTRKTKALFNYSNSQQHSEQLYHYHLMMPGLNLSSCPPSDPNHSTSPSLLRGFTTSANPPTVTPRPAACPMQSQPQLISSMAPSFLSEFR